MKKILTIASMGMLLQTTAFAQDVLSFKDSEEFNNMQSELQKLKQSHSSAALDELWEQANQIAELNDRCGVISLTEMLDEECGHFYKVELPAFEAKFMQVTGEVRIGSVQLEKDVKGKATQISACLDAMASLYVPKGQLTRLQGGVINMEPLDKEGETFEVEYDFTLTFDDSKIQIITNLGKMWVDKCGEIIADKGKFRPLFKKSIGDLNDSVAKAADIDVAATMEGSQIIFDEKNNLGGDYFLGEKAIFSSKGIESGAYMIVDVGDKSVTFPSSSKRFKKRFSGKKKFSGVSDVTGRWMINSRLAEIRRQKRIAEEQKRRAELKEKKRLEKIDKKLGTLEDTRDGKTYRTIRIGTKVWMAENLNFKTEDDSYCYNKKKSNCKKYGRLYSYAAALQACPAGWHLPTTVEYSKLVKSVKEPVAKNLIESEKVLFRAPLAGYIDNSGYPKAMDKEARFWTSSESGSGRAFYFSITEEEVDTKHNQKFAGFSVRCVEDEQ